MNMAFLQRGFRPFFLLAICFAALSTLLWTAIYFGKTSLSMSGMSNMHWHAHEMVYGYSMAVFAGFLLTAAQNWTGIATLHGTKLAILAGLWSSARVCFSMGYYRAAFVLDVLFAAWLAYDTTMVVAKSGNWKHMAVLTKLYALIGFNVLFYMSVFDAVDQALGMRLSIYGGLFLIVGLIQMMGRRLVPFFVERASKGDIHLRNHAILDRLLLALFILFYIVELIGIFPVLSGALAILYAVINSARLIMWNCGLIWKRPLLWVLYLALWSITLGFFLLGLAKIIPQSPYPSIHALSYGGIGLATIGMMIRVTRGHTGRDIYTASRIEPIIFVTLIIGTCIRVFLPMAIPSYQVWWIGLSQLCWITAFSLALITCAPMLIAPRVDGNSG